jgi:hypothetical protein
MSAIGSLWTNAAPWRWLSSAALMTTLVALYLQVTPTYRPASQTPRASYDAGAQRSASAAASPAGSTALANSPRVSTQSPGIAPPPPAPAPSDVSTASRSPASPPGTRALGGAVTFVKGHTEGEVTGGGLIAGYCCAGASSTVYASRPVTAGKHYYEIELRTRKGERSPDTWTNAGIAKQVVRPPPSAARGVGDAAYDVISRGRRQRFSDGDVFMFALDMDRGYFYYGVNGAWSNAVPGRDPGAPLAREPYVPFVTVSASSSHPDKDTDRWVANFGQNPFRYTPPTDYGAYGSGSSATGAAGNVITPVAPDSSVPSQQAGLMGQSFTDVMTLGGMKIPLPEGTWTVVAFQRGGPNRPGLEIAVLANIAGRKLGGLVAVSAYADPRQSGAGFPASGFCNRTDYVARETRANEPSGLQECWWVNHAMAAWNQDVMRAARSDLAMRGVTDLPDTMMNVGVWVADLNKHVNMLVYFDPRAEGIQTARTSWEASDWHRARIANHPDKAQYVNKLESFGRSWAQIVRANL